MWIAYLNGKVGRQTSDFNVRVRQVELFNSICFFLFTNELSSE